MPIDRTTPAGKLPHLFHMPLTATKKKITIITPAMKIQSALLNSAMHLSYSSSFSRALFASAKSGFMLSA